MEGEVFENGPHADPETGSDLSDEPGIRYPTLSQIAVLICLLPFSFLIQGAFYPDFPRLSVVASGASIILLVSLLIRRWGMAWREALMIKGIDAGVAFSAVLTIGALGVVLAEVQALTSPYFPPMPLDLVESTRALATVQDGRDLIAVVLAVVLFPAVSEEMLFRGLILRGLCGRFGPIAGVVGSGVLFALVHLNPWQLLPLSLIGIFIGFIVYRTGSLYTGIIAHGANNLFSIAALNMGPGVGTDTIQPSCHLPFMVVVGALLLFLGGTASLIYTPKKTCGGPAAG